MIPEAAVDSPNDPVGSYAKQARATRDAHAERLSAMARTVIPDEAMEAAHKAWRAQAKLDGTIFEYNLRAAVEAAAQIIAAEAWEQGAIHTLTDTSKHFGPNPYR